jgi:hypothetical protein
LNILKMKIPTESAIFTHGYIESSFFVDDDMTNEGCLQIMKCHINLVLKGFEPYKDQANGKYIYEKVRMGVL